MMMAMKHISWMSLMLRPKPKPHALITPWGPNCHITPKPDVGVGLSLLQRMGIAYNSLADAHARPCHHPPIRSDSDQVEY